MKKWICMALVLGMLLVLGGCGVSEKDALLGSWETEMDMTDILNDAMTSEDPEVGEYLKVDAFPLRVTLTFTEEDTYAMSVDEVALMDTMENLKLSIIAGMERYLVDSVAAMGVEMSIEDILAASGVSLEALVDEIVTQELIDTMVAEIESEGKFKAEDGKLYLSAGLQYEVDENIYERYTLEGTCLTLVEYVSTEEVDAYTRSLYPMVFEKVS